jgi:hypothetical protein
MLYPLILNQPDSLGLGTSLGSARQAQLAIAIRRERAQAALRSANDAAEAEKPFTPKGKKMGVWIDGKLRLQTRDRDAIDDFAARAVADKRNSGVWVAPIGSFLEV